MEAWRRERPNREPEGMPVAGREAGAGLSPRGKSMRFDVPLALMDGYG